jgi:Xaa-Pro aminopeptidase
VEALRPGGTSKDVFTATLAYIERHHNELKTATAQGAAADALKRKGYALHGLGIDMAEGTPKTFQAGNVLCYEPQLTAGNQAFS